jgi:transcriptional regulator with XRE-family HTH domain
MEALGAFIRSQRAMAGLSLRELSARAEVSNAYLSQVERGLHEPSLRVLHSIGVALEVPFDLLLAQADLLTAGEDRPDSEHGATASGDDTEAAILADRALSGPQKFALLSIYRSFRDI